MNRVWLYSVPVLGAALIGGAIYLLLSGVDSAPEAEPAPAALVLWCGEDLRGPVGGTALEHGGGLASHFERRTGIAVKTFYGEPSALLERLERSEAAEPVDLFLPGDERVLSRARAAGLVESVHEVAALAPVIILERGNPHGVENLEDLLEKPIRLAVADVRESDLGRLTGQLLGRGGELVRGESVSGGSPTHQLTTHHSPSGPQLLTGGNSIELARMVQSRQAEAAIVWRHVARRFPGHPIIEISTDSTMHSPLRVGVLRSAAGREDAAALAEFLGSPVGQVEWQRYGLSEREE